jgi:hypothetical protein
MFGWWNANNKKGEQMKKILKRYLKFAIGTAVLLVAVLVFIQTRHTTDLENGQLKDWLNATETRKTAAVRILTASDANLGLLVKCVDKMAMLPNSGEMYVRDAAELCFMGIKLQEATAKTDEKKIKNVKRTNH